MGYFVPASADDRLAGPYASYDAALTALRADSGASDGDAYVLSSGQLFAAYVSEGPGILIPSDLYPRISGYVSNASGDSYLTTADTKADLTARGWFITEDNEGTVTGGDGSAFRLDAGTNIGGSADTAALGFTPTSNQTSMISLIKGQPILGTAIGQAYMCSLRDGSNRFDIAPNDGATGSFNVFGTGTSALAAAIGSIDETAATWFVMLFDTTASTNVLYFRRIESAPEEALAVEDSALQTTANSWAPYMRCFQGSIGSQTVVDIYEAHTLVMT